MAKIKLGNGWAMKKRKPDRLMYLVDFAILKNSELVGTAGFEPVF